MSFLFSREFDEQMARLQDEQDRKVLATPGEPRCPPCNGNCLQGDTCPQFVERRKVPESMWDVEKEMLMAVRKFFGRLFHV
jgi:hypothetical protein